MAFSLKGQPLWFRAAKWVVLLAIAWRFSNRPDFWLWVAGGLILGIVLHLFWRSKTQRWTKPWGGWSDIQGNDK